MNEARWLAAEGPTLMLHALPEHLDGRRARLFACGCCRRAWHLLPDLVYRQAVAINEDYADGLVDESEWHHWGQQTAELRAPTREDLLRATSAVGRLFARWWGWNSRRFADEIATEVREALAEEAERQAFARGHMRWETQALGQEVARQEEAYQAVLLRDIFGNPFRPNRAVGPFSPTLRDLAQAIANGQSDSVPVLHDALIEEGRADLAEHFRTPTHPRGCWLIDLLLGRPPENAPHG
jgi:hypothetical protein